MSARRVPPAPALLLAAALCSLACRDERPAAPPAQPVAVQPADEIEFFTCPMHPSVESETPANCPICGMTLDPVTKAEASSGVITIDEARRKAIGVRTAVVERGPLELALRAVGRVVVDETALADVTLKYRGFIGELYADATGRQVERGQALFTLYSPELFTAQQEFLLAIASREAARDTAAPDRADYLVNASRQRLRLWDLEDWQIDELEARGEPWEYVPIISPVSGVVVEKNVVAGAAFEAGARLYRIAGLDRVWVEAVFYESEQALLEVGLPVRLTFPYLPEQEFRGRIGFIYPYLDQRTRTVRVRVELPNPAGALKPDMYADVVLERRLEDRLTVPEEAVLYAGERRFVFVDLGEAKLAPREVRVGARSDERVEILSGLSPHETIVVSGNFLVAAESRLKLAMERWE